MTVRLNINYYNLTLVELSSKYGVTSKTLQNWKRQLLENASVAFDPSKIVSVYLAYIAYIKMKYTVLSITMMSLLKH